jgi:hypothetical protein
MRSAREGGEGYVGGELADHFATFGCGLEEVFIADLGRNPHQGQIVGHHALSPTQSVDLHRRLWGCPGQTEWVSGGSGYIDGVSFLCALLC